MNGNKFGQAPKKTHENSKVDFRWRNLRNLVKKYIQGENLLDAGCGTGHLTLELLQEGFTVTATDYSPELVDFTRKILEQTGYCANVYQLDLRETKALTEENYDTIVCLDVLEHIDNDMTALQNLKNALKPGGVLIISVPALDWLYGHRDERIGHHRRYSKHELIKKLADVGFEISMVRFWNMIGLFPYLISEKLLKISIDEKVRHNNESRWPRSQMISLIHGLSTLRITSTVHSGFHSLRCASDPKRKQSNQVYAFSSRALQALFTASMLKGDVPPHAKEQGIY